MALSSSKLIGGIQFGVSMRTDKLQKDIKKSQSMIGGFVKSISKTTLAFTGLGAAISGVGLASFIKEAAYAIDNLAKTSDKLGIATEQLAGLRLAAEETGVAANTLDMGIQRMVRRISEAAMGTGEAKNALKELGLSARDLNRLAPDRQFREIARAMALVDNQADKIRLSMRLFDSEGVALVNTLKLGSEGLDEAADAARSLGIAIDRDSAEAVEKAIDSFNRFKKAIGGIFQDLAVSISPFIDKVSTFLQDVNKNLDKLKQFAGNFGQVLNAQPSGKPARTLLDDAQTGVPGLSAITSGAAREGSRNLALFFDEVGRAVKLTNGGDFRNGRGFFQFMAEEFGPGGRGVAAFVPDTGPRSTSGGELFKDFRTRESIAALNQRQVDAALAPFKSFGKSLEQMFAGAGSPIQKAFRVARFKTFTGAAKGVLGNFAQTPLQTGQGLLDSLKTRAGITGAIFSTLFSNFDATKLKPAMAGAGNAPRGSLQFSETGSVASYNAQRERRRANEEQKRDIARNSLLEQIRDNTAGGGIVQAMIG